MMIDRVLVAGCVGHNYFWLSKTEHDIYWYSTFVFTTTACLCFILSKVVMTYNLSLHLSSHLLGTFSSISLSMLAEIKKI